MFRWEMFCKLVGSIFFTWFPYLFELAMFDSVFYPPVSHVEGFYELLAEVSDEDNFHDGTVGRYAGSAGWLWVVELGQCGDDGDCLLAADEDAACFCFGCGGDDVL